MSLTESGPPCCDPVVSPGGICIQELVCTDCVERETLAQGLTTVPASAALARPQVPQRSAASATNILGVVSLALGIVAVQAIFAPDSDLAVVLASGAGWMLWLATATLRSLLHLYPSVTALLAGGAGFLLAICGCFAGCRRQGPTLAFASSLVALGMTTLVCLGALMTAGVTHCGNSTIAAAHIKGTLVPAIQRYQMRHNDQLPASLDDLVADQAVGLKPESVIDPWNQPYQYHPRSSHGSAEGFDIWTYLPNGKVIGNWPSDTEGVR